MINFRNAKLQKVTGNISQFPNDGLDYVCISGKSNVGKSSMINTLLDNKNMAKTSSVPGKTVTINFFDIDNKFYLVDLPGYGYAKRSDEEIEKLSVLTDSFFTGELSSKIKLVVQLIDSKAGITKNDRIMLDYLNQLSIDYVVVVTKTDKINKTSQNELQIMLNNDPDISSDHPIVFFSSLKKTGREELQKVISKTINVN